MRSLLYRIIFCLVAMLFVAALSYAIPIWFIILSDKFEAAELSDRIFEILKIKTALPTAILALIFSIWAALQWDDYLLVKLLRFFLILGMVISGITYIGLKSIL